MSKYINYARFTRSLSRKFMEAKGRREVALAKLQLMGKTPIVPPKPLVNPVEIMAIQQMNHRVPKCGCLRHDCPVCGFVAFVVRVNATTLPLLNGNP